MYIAHILHDEARSEEQTQTCTAHARSVAELASAALADCGLPDAAYLAGLLHDCGKYTEEFQTYLTAASRGEKVRKGSVIHTFAGVRYLLEHCHSHGAERLSAADAAAEIIATSIGSHHGLFDIWDANHANGFTHRMTRQPEYDARAIDAFHQECADEQELQVRFQAAAGELSDLITKRIASHTHGPEERFFELSLLTRLLTSAVIDADRTDTRCFAEQSPLPAQDMTDWSACAAHVNAHVQAFPRGTPIQQARGAFSDQCAAAAEGSPGLYRLDLPTGGGKTLAALRFAVCHAQRHRMRRILYVAPLLSVIEQNAQVIRDAVGDTFPVAEHHSDVVRDALSPDELTELDLVQENWDAPILITTLVQLLNTLFSGKTSCVRRFHRLCQSVLIIDEVQSVPTKLVSLFNCAVNFLVQVCGATVVLCSATQPAFDRARHRMLPPARLVSEAFYAQYAPLFRRTELRDAGAFTMQGLVRLTEETLARENSLLIVCNTKREAAELFRLLEGLTDVQRFHLSAGMCMAHRKDTLKVLQKALSARTKLVCVATQVIEAGIDISFDAVIRLAAGLDSVVQAAGRCNRHGEHATPQPVQICRMQDESLASLQEIRNGRDALNALLADHARQPEQYSYDLSSEQAVQAYYTHLYRALPLDAMDFPVKGQPTLFEMLSVNGQFSRNAGADFFLRQAFRTAGDLFCVFDEDSESVLVPYQMGEKLIDQLSELDAERDWQRAGTLLAEAKPFVVSVSARQIERMQRDGMLCPLLGGRAYALNKGNYDDATGIREGESPCSTLIL